jgi:hypothetical protein
MTIQQPHGSDGTTSTELADPRTLLFSGEPRLGWIYRDRRTLCSPFPEPPPDADAMRQQAAARLAAAQQHWQRALKWVLRPSLFILIGLVALGGCAHALNPGAPFGTTILTAVILAIPGTGWTLWRLVQLNLAKDADPQRLYQAAYAGWQQRAAEHEHAELARLGSMPEWDSAAVPARRADIYGGTLIGWRSLLTVHGASLLAGRPLLVADLSGQDTTRDLAALAQYAGIDVARYLLPRDLDRCGLLAALSARQLGTALAEAIHAGAPGGARADRAVDLRVLEQLSDTIASGGMTPARLAAAVQAALGRETPPGLLTQQETDRIKDTLFGDGYKQQVGANLVRLDAFLSDLAAHAGTGPPQVPAPAYCTFLSLEPAARSARAELIAALVIQWLTVQVTGQLSDAPAMIIAGADEITRSHAERLADACDHRGVPLTLLYRHLRDDALVMIGGGTTGFMRLGNHHESEQAASFIGRQHKFVLSQVTATHGGDHTVTHGRTESWGHGESRGFASNTGWSRDHMLGGGSTSGGRTCSRDYGRNYSWAEDFSQSEGTNWNDATSRQRVYEFTVEPKVLQTLPDTALLLACPGGEHADVQSVDCHPAIITLPQATTAPLDPAGRQPGMILPPQAPHAEPVQYTEQPPWPSQPPPADETHPAWPPQDPSANWWNRRDSRS